MGIRNGSQYIESLRDERTIYVNGARVKDVTTHPPFRGVVETLASLYDLQHQSKDVLTYASPSSGEAVAMGFMQSETIEETERRAAAEEIRAEHTHGLMGRMPDFCNAMVTDIAMARAFVGRSNKSFGDNAVSYYEECRERDWCLTHTLVDPQIDRSKGPAQQDDPFLMLRVVRETDAGVIVRGARMLSTLAPFSNELWVGPFYPRQEGEEDYTLSFALPCATPGLKFVCREPYSTERSSFDRPLSSRYDEEDALAVFDDVLVPWERMFIYRDISIYNGVMQRTPGYTVLQAVIRGLAKLRMLAGLAIHIAEAIGRSEMFHVQAQIGEMVANAEMIAGLVRAGIYEVSAGARASLPHRSLSATLWVAIPQMQVRAIETIKQLSGSGLIMTPTEKDFANPEIAAHLERYLRGRGIAAKDRVQLFKLAWDMIGEPFGSRQLQYEYFYAGDPYFNRIRFFRSPVARQYHEIVKQMLASSR